MVNFYTDNKQTWGQNCFAKQYSKSIGLNAPEKTIIDILRDKLKGRKLLDIGVGAGRTTPHLLEVSSNYKGVDYSPAMIEAARRRYPGIQFEVGDAAQPFREGDGSYDLILFSVNGIDSLPHEDRLKALREFKRLLSPDGFLVFSSHNLGFLPRNLKPWAWKRLHSKSVDLLTPLRAIRYTPRWLMGMVRCFRNRKYEHAYKDYSIVNDGTENYKFLQYYISISSQIDQLRACGFSRVRPFDLDGKEVDAAQYNARDDIWITYLCSN
jgi:SAM-dependent methyltransferase